MKVRWFSIIFALVSALSIDPTFAYLQLPTLGAEEICRCAQCEDSRGRILLLEDNSNQLRSLRRHRPVDLLYSTPPRRFRHLQMCQVLHQECQ